MPCYCYRMEGMCGPCCASIRAEGGVPNHQVALPDPNGPWAQRDQDMADAAWDGKQERLAAYREAKSEEVD